jgi:hypothetical protein
VIRPLSKKTMMFAEGLTWPPSESNLRRQLQMRKSYSRSQWRKRYKDSNLMYQMLFQSWMSLVAFINNLQEDHNTAKKQHSDPEDCIFDMEENFHRNII